MSVLLTLVAAGLLPLEESAQEGTNWYPFLVGGGALVILFGLMIALLAFGKGREHT